MRRRSLGGRNAELDAIRLRVLLNQVAQPQTPVDHGSLQGLGDDDHTQYVHVSVARTVSAQHTFNPSAAGAPFLLGANAQGQLVAGFNADQLDGYEGADFALAGHNHDHGGLQGLGDDDHTQYVHVSVGRTISAQHTFNPSAAGAPFLLGANAQGQLVAGFNADQLDGYEGADFALVSRQIIAGAGLSGGGDLSADRTLAVQVGPWMGIANDRVQWEPSQFLAVPGGSGRPETASSLAGAISIVQDGGVVLVPPSTSPLQGGVASGIDKSFSIIGIGGPLACRVDRPSIEINSASARQVAIVGVGFEGSGANTPALSLKNTGTYGPEWRLWNCYIHSTATGAGGIEITFPGTAILYGCEIYAADGNGLATIGSGAPSMIHLYGCRIRATGSSSIIGIALGYNTGAEIRVFGGSVEGGSYSLQADGGTISLSGIPYCPQGFQELNGGNVRGRYLDSLWNEQVA